MTRSLIALALAAAACTFDVGTDVEASISQTLISDLDGTCTPTSGTEATELGSATYWVARSEVSCVFYATWFGTVVEQIDVQADLDEALEGRSLDPTKVRLTREAVAFTLAPFELKQDGAPIVLPEGSSLFAELIPCLQGDCGTPPPFLRLDLAGDGTTSVDANQVEVDQRVWAAHFLGEGTTIRPSNAYGHAEVTIPLEGLAELDGSTWSIDAGLQVHIDSLAKYRFP